MRAAGRRSSVPAKLCPTSLRQPQNPAWHAFTLKQGVLFAQRGSGSCRRVRGWGRPGTFTSARRRRRAQRRLCCTRSRPPPKSAWRWRCCCSTWRTMCSWALPRSCSTRRFGARLKQSALSIRSFESMLWEVNCMFGLLSSNLRLNDHAVECRTPVLAHLCLQGVACLASLLTRVGQDAQAGGCVMPTVEDVGIDACCSWNDQSIEQLQCSALSSARCRA